MIEASHEVLHPSNEQSFLVRKFDERAFSAPYHFHDEFELTLITKGKGKRFVGSHMGNFAEGDLVLLGTKLPHCWKLEPDNFEGAGAIVIQFSKDFLGGDFLNKSELFAINKLLKESSSGILFTDKLCLQVQKSMLNLSDNNNAFDVLMDFLSILQALATSNNYCLLDTQNSIATQSLAETERMNAIYRYIVENFREQIALNEAAEIAHMSPNAFCKYFRKTTRKTFMETVIEYRLNHATQQLIQSDKAITEVAFESGFTDVSHFYKMFKSKMTVSPLNYRKRFMLGVG